MSDETRRRRDELLSAYLDDALGADERATVEALLRDDADARAWLGEMRALMKATRAVDVAPPVPPDLHDRIRARLDVADHAATFAARGPVVLYSRLGDEELASRSPARETARPFAAPTGSRPRSPLRAGTIAAWVTVAAALVVGVVLLEQRGVHAPVPAQQSQSEDAVREAAAAPESAEAGEAAPPLDEVQPSGTPSTATDSRARVAQGVSRRSASREPANADAPQPAIGEGSVAGIDSDAAPSGRGTSEPSPPPPPAESSDRPTEPAPSAAPVQAARDQAEPRSKTGANEHKKLEESVRLESADSAAASREAAGTAPPDEQEKRIRGRAYQETLSFAKTAPAASPPACPSIWVAEPPLARAPGRPAVTGATLEPVARELGGVIVPEDSPISRLVVPRAEWTRALVRLEALGFVLPAGYPQPPGDAPCAAARLTLDPS